MMYRPRPRTSTMRSLNLEDGASGICRGRRFTTEILSASAHARKQPNRITLTNDPLVSRCPAAQRQVASSMGCLVAFFMRPGKYAAKKRTKTGSSTNNAKRCSHSGGTYRSNESELERPYPQMISTNPNVAASEYNPFQGHFPITLTMRSRHGSLTIEMECTPRKMRSPNKNKAIG